MRHRRSRRVRPVTLVALFLALILALPAAVAATERHATPNSDRGTLAEGVMADRLIKATLSQLDLPPSVDILALARVTLRPGATATAVEGAHLFVVEAGALTVWESLSVPPPPSGSLPPTAETVPYLPAGPYHAGDQFLVRSGVASLGAIINGGAEPAVALVVSIAARSPAGPGELLTPGAVVEPLAVASATWVEPLLGADGLGADPISVSLVRVSYEAGAGRGPRGELIDEAMIDVGRIIVESGARLLAVEAGALNVLVADPALYTPAAAAPKQLPSDVRASLTPGDELLLFAPGRMLTRNVGRGPSTVLIVTVGTAPSAIVPRTVRS